MPYTPPSQQSPASSKNSTPAISRNSSYSQDIHTLSPTHNRPSLPRSISSATYLNKHRRSPSATISGNQDPSAYKFNTSKDAESVLFNGSLRQSPPPLNDMTIPTGAIISPPDSSENSDGDEASTRTSRRREVENTWNELQQAVRSMSIKRDPSPVKSGSIPHTTTSEPTTSMTSPTLSSPSRLSTEARKISHSRSSTETAIPHMNTSSSDQTSCSDDSDDELRLGKPPLVRKKSGELVKPALRPSSRRRYSSMPGTPTYSKSVHFNDDGNQTRHFLQVDKPSAVSAGSSPVETYESDEFPFEGSQSSRVEWDMKLANFPSPDDHTRKSKPIWIERFFLSADNKSLVGEVAVANISFHKSVVARFTLDYWKTTSEVSAEYSDDVRKQSQSDGYDRFTFTIRLADQANLETKTLLLCMRYNVIGQEHWDNNNDTNYQIDFVKKVNRVASKQYSTPLGARPLNAIPRSRHSPPASRGRPRAPSIDDDMTSHLDNSYHFGASDDLLGDDSRAAIKLKPKSKRGVAFPSANQSSQGLGGRYDFGASLSAALSNAQDKLGKQAGLMTHKASSAESKGYFSKDSNATETAQKKIVEPERPEALTVDRPAMGSAQYKDLVSKFCYFTPPGTKLSPQAPLKKALDSTDGSAEHNEYFQSGSKSPSPTRAMSPQLDGTNERGYFSASVSPFSSRTASPGRGGKNAHSSRSLSPAKFGFPYHHERDSFLTNSPTPTAIQG
ncbi:carbohydrate-binding module family 21 protein [Myriangium duriaei CBS 260.36]|uniref:Carbohydrate-binding module family 21 protein n=1 Tax=Myriangium duriaei CBS 260.36 TaxID=1168546 RepID=A0A9P4IX02_9PEZI|nr:carbohydrate-binding module family 21 protein [Myriangium duriaei CBS 260.36]